MGLLFTVHPPPMGLLFTVHPLWWASFYTLSWLVTFLFGPPSIVHSLLLGPCFTFSPPSNLHLLGSSIFFNLGICCKFLHPAELPHLLGECMSCFTEPAYFPQRIETPLHMWILQVQPYFLHPKQDTTSQPWTCILVITIIPPVLDVYCAIFSSTLHPHTLPLPQHPDILPPFLSSQSSDFHMDTVLSFSSPPIGWAARSSPAPIGSRGDSIGRSVAPWSRRLLWLAGDWNVTAGRSSAGEVVWGVYTVCVPEE